MPVPAGCAKSFAGDASCVVPLLQTTPGAISAPCAFAAVLGCTPVSLIEAVPRPPPRVQRPMPLGVV